ESLDSGRLIENVQAGGKGEPGLFLDFVDQAYGQQGIASEIKEVIIDPDRLDRQNLFPYLRQLPFQQIPGRNEDSFRWGMCQISRGKSELLSQTNALRFAGRTFWYVLQNDHSSWHLEIG